ncbi:MAG: prolyl oligopeptidase family serine peptidase [Gemmataceae bacterium]|nr:prolyl oligopeptidase family serine peptidase [Gemmataceae bacterium]
MLALLVLLAPLEKGTFRFVPAAPQDGIPARYRLEERAFPYELERKREMAGIGVGLSLLRFPSPVKSKHEPNNTVHAEYYRPLGKGPFPGVIVLDITGGNQMLSRYIANHLATQGVAGLFVQMAYYGPRRKGTRIKLMSPDLKQTTAGVTQTVLDLRVAAAWLASRPEIDPKRLGISGTSLGSFVSALTAEMEPRLGRCVVLLGGGNFVDGFAGHPLAAPFVTALELLGYKRDGIRKLLAPIDPITCAEKLKDRRLLILAASKDEIVPPSMARMLFDASGKQELVWYDAGHYTAALHLADALERVTRHFKKE